MQIYSKIKINKDVLTFFCTENVIFLNIWRKVNIEFWEIKTPAVAKKTAGDNQIYKMEKCLVGNIFEEIGQVIVQLKGTAVLGLEILLALVS